MNAFSCHRGKAYKSKISNNHHKTKLKPFRFNEGFQSLSKANWTSSFCLGCYEKMENPYGVSNSYGR